MATLRRFAFIALSVVLLAACGSSTAPATNADSVVARVGGTTILQSQLSIRVQSTLTALAQGGAPTSVAAMANQVRAGVLRSLILDAVIAQEAAHAGVAATTAEVQGQVAADARAAGGMSKLEQQLASAGGSIAQLQDEIRSQLNEERLEDAFARQRAALVEQQLARGAKFAVVAKDMSDDTGTSAKGGDLGRITTQDLGSYDADFVAAMRALAPGTYTRAPVHDSGGYDIIEVDARGSGWWRVRHILVAAPSPYTVRDRPAWFAEALFTTVAQLCTEHEIHVYIRDAGADPCSGAPSLSPEPTLNEVPTPAISATPTLGPRLTPPPG